LACSLDLDSIWIRRDGLSIFPSRKDGCSDCAAGVIDKELKRATAKNSAESCVHHSIRERDSGFRFDVSPIRSIETEFLVVRCWCQWCQKEQTHAAASQMISLCTMLGPCGSAPRRRGGLHCQEKLASLDQNMPLDSRALC